MQTGFEIMDYDKHLKSLWVRRTLAAIVDFGITWGIAILILYFIKPMALLDYLLTLFLQGPVWYIYSVIFDAVFGKTPGKFIFKIRAVAFIGNISVVQALLRNLTKLNILIVITDAIAGLSTEGDPRQRYSERFINTLVISEKKGKRIRSFQSAMESKFIRDDKDELLLPK